MEKITTPNKDSRVIDERVIDELVRSIVERMRRNARLPRMPLSDDQPRVYIHDDSHDQPAPEDDGEIRTHTSYTTSYLA